MRWIFLGSPVQTLRLRRPPLELSVPLRMSQGTRTDRRMWWVSNADACAGCSFFSAEMYEQSRKISKAIIS